MTGTDQLASPAAASGSSGAGGATGNEALNDAFNYAITEARQTLTITTKKGADLYAMKQRPQ